jgi:BlaI family penicillinase repressor
MKIKLSDGEWKLMNQLWERFPGTIMELTARMKEDTGWSKNTIITILSRLESKGAVRHEVDGRTKRYYPAVPRQEAAKTETESFLKKVYGSSLGLMVNAMLQSNSLTQEDIAELSDILKRAEEEST